MAVLLRHQPKPKASRRTQVTMTEELLASLGAYEVGRGEYLSQVARVTKQEVTPDLIAAALANWRAHF